MRRKTIGDQELALLQYLGENEPASVGEVAAGFGEYAPLDPGTGEEAFRRNRRIEFKLTEG